ncbi:MAG: hypothetical protein WCG81_19125, partial [Candidatus Angelobacter sp.]
PLGCAWEGIAAVTSEITTKELRIKDWTRYLLRLGINSAVAARHRFRGQNRSRLDVLAYV